jgi:hypothetical protein
MPYALCRMPLKSFFCKDGLSAGSKRCVFCFTCLMPYALCLMPAAPPASRACQQAQQVCFLLLLYYCFTNAVLLLYYCFTTVFTKCQTRHAHVITRSMTYALRVNLVHPAAQMSCQLTRSMTYADVTQMSRACHHAQHDICAAGELVQGLGFRV